MRTTDIDPKVEAVFTSCPRGQGWYEEWLCPSLYEGVKEPWRQHIYPNHLIPALAPYAPLVSVTASGFIQLQSASNYMVALTQAGGFRPSEVVLQNAVMNASLFALLHKRLSALPIALATESSVGQASAIWPMNC